MPVIILVQDAIQKMVSIVMGSSWPEPVLPEAFSKMMSPSLLTAAKTTPGAPSGSDVSLSISALRPSTAEDFTFAILKIDLFTDGTAGQETSRGQ